MNKYELVIIWETGEKDIFLYGSREEAEKIEKGYKIAFGRQVWTCINEKEA